MASNSVLPEPALTVQAKPRWRGIPVAGMMVTVLTCLVACQHEKTPEDYIKQFQSTDPAVRLKAGNELMKFDPDQVVPLLLAAANDELVRVRFEVMRMLGRCRDPRGIPVLIAALGDKSPRPAAMAAASLALMRAPEALPALLKYADDPSLDVRRYVISALGPCHSYETMPAQSDSALEVVLRALHDPEPKVRVAALESIREFGYKNAGQELIRLAADPSPEVRYVAVQALGELATGGHTQRGKTVTRDPIVPVDEHLRQAISYALLARLVPEEFQSVRTQSMRALGDMREISAVDKLKELQAKGTEEDRREARRALALIEEVAPGTGK